MRDATVQERANPAGAGGAPVAPRRTGRTVLAVAVGLLVGFAVALFVPRLLDDDGAAAPIPDDESRTLAEERDAAAEAAADERRAPDGAGAESPEAAVTGFLDAESTGDFETSFGYLSAEDRRTYATSAGWVARHADVLGKVEGYELVEVRDAEVVTTVRFTPSLDQVVGLVPGEARITWTTAEDADGSWGVALEESVIEPLLPADEGAATAAQAWVDARRACGSPEFERAALVGSPALADRLCDAGDVSLGAVEPLSQADAQTVFGAYGPTATSAARAVRTSGAVDLGVVLIPVGETWTVIAVVP